MKLAKVKLILFLSLILNIFLLGFVLKSYKEMELTNNKNKEYEEVLDNQFLLVVNESEENTPTLAVPIIFKSNFDCLFWRDLINSSEKNLKSKQWYCKKY